jgi:hypothetical protein
LVTAECRRYVVDHDKHRRHAFDGGRDRAHETGGLHDARAAVGRGKHCVAGLVGKPLVQLGEIVEAVAVAQAVQPDPAANLALGLLGANQDNGGKTANSEISASLRRRLRNGSYHRGAQRIILTLFGRVPFVFVTGYDKGRILDGYRVFPVLQKPFHRSELSDILAKLLTPKEPSIKSQNAPSERISIQEVVDGTPGDNRP